MRSSIILSALFIASVGLGGVGCGVDAGEGSDPSDQSEDVEIDGKTDTLAVPLGDYELAKAHPSAGEMMTFSLEADKTFTRHMFTYCGVTSPEYHVDCGEEAGTYKLTKNSSGQRYIRYYDADGDLIIRVGYTYSSSKYAVTIRDLDTGHKYVMNKDVAQPLN